MKRRKKSGHFWRNVILFSVSVAILIFAIVVIWLSSLRIPDFSSFDNRRVENSTKIYDRTGEILLYDIHRDTRRTDISYQDMGVNIRNATVAIEDSEFYNHNGIRIKSIIRAALSNFLGTGRTQGGSTITQQLVKNTLLTKEKSYTRKLKESVLAVKVDKFLSKEKILEHYLNEAPYGGTIYGIEEASVTYFNKKAADLTLAEAAYLASIPQAPTTLSPYGRNRDKLEARKNLVLDRMLEVGFITPEEYSEAKEEEVVFSPQAVIGIRAPHFVFFIRDYLEEKYGSEMVLRGGLKVTTTLDYDLQEKGEEIVKEGALRNEEVWDGENASLVAIDPKTGEILTMVGSRGYFDEDIDGNFNVAVASRQPGSSFKPFIYATAFNKGFTPDSILFDLPTEFQTTCDPGGRAKPGRDQADCYMPSNYDGEHRGPMTLRNALAQSVNIPAVKLFYLAGLSNSLKTAEGMGISTLGDVGRYGLTLVIGGGEVSLLDMTSAYGVFANEGVRNPYTGILKIEDTEGNILEEFKPNPQNILPKNTALTISDIMSDEKSRIPTFGSRSVLYIPGRDVAVKTGTTNSNRDAWTIGYTPSIVAGVWAGNNDNTPMKKGGSAVAGPIWNKFMNEALKNIPSEKFREPDLNIDPMTVKPVLRGSWVGNDNFFIDKISKKLATPNTPKETLEEKIITNVHSILYWVNKNDIHGEPPRDSSRDSQFLNWEVPVLDWWVRNKFRYQITTLAEKPDEFDDIHIEANRPVLSITEPKTDTMYSPNQKINLKVKSSGRYPLNKIDVFVNNSYLGTYNTQSTFSFTPSKLDNLQIRNELRIIGHDTVFNSSEETVIFQVQ